jgi:hypothetical protein
MFIPDPTFSIPDPNFSIPDPGSTSKNIKYRYFNPKKRFLRCRKYDPACSSRIRILTFYPSRIRILTFYPSRNPDPAVKKAPDPGSGFAILIFAMTLINTVHFPTKCLNNKSRDPDPYRKIPKTFSGSRIRQFVTVPRFNTYEWDSMTHGPNIYINTKP